MGWFILKHIFSTILSILNITRLSNQETDLEILILRQQLSILQRKHNSPIQPDRVEKITLAVLPARLKRITPPDLQIHCEMLSASSSLRPSFAGIANEFAGNGPTHTRTRVDDRQSAKRLRILCSALLMRTPVGDMAKSKVSSSS
jgi:hypothetical protein